MNPATIPAPLGNMRALQASMLAKRKARRAVNWPSGDVAVGVALAFAAVFLAVTKLAGWWPA